MLHPTTPLPQPTPSCWSDPFHTVTFSVPCFTVQRNCFNQLKLLLSGHPWKDAVVGTGSINPTLRGKESFLAWARCHLQEIKDSYGDFHWVALFCVSRGYPTTHADGPGGTHTVYLQLCFLFCSVLRKQGGELETSLGQLWHSFLARLAEENHKVKESKLAREGER